MPTEWGHPDRRLDRSGRNSYHRSTKTIVSEKGQITIPKTLRVRLGIRARQVLEVKEDAGRLIFTKAELADPVESVFGILDLGRSTDQVMTSLRGKPETK